jgi:hypothetical protein
MIALRVDGTSCPLSEEEARELSTRLRRRSTDPLDNPAVVATQIEQLLEQPGTPELRLLDSEENELAWTIHEWLDDVGVDVLPDRAMGLRHALEAARHVRFIVRGSSYALPWSQATILAESLRVKATGGPGVEGSAGARDVADAIEAVLVGAKEEPIELEGDRADAVFYVLHVSFDSAAALTGEGYSLYQAVREIHNQLIGK